MNKLILASNLPRAARPTQVVGAHMQRFCNCKTDTQTAEKAAAKKTA